MITRIFLALKPYLLMLAVIAGMVALAGAFKIGGDVVRAEWDREKAANETAGRTLDNAINNGVAAITNAARIHDEAQNAKNIAFRESVTAGIKRLSIPVVIRAPDGSGIGDTESRADIVPAVAGRIIGIVQDGDNGLRKLNECIDKYNLVKSEVDAANLANQ